MNGQDEAVILTSKSKEYIIIALEQKQDEPQPISMTCMLCSLANPWQMLTNVSSSARSIWCLIGDMFCHEKHDIDAWIQS